MSASSGLDRFQAAIAPLAKEHVLPAYQGRKKGGEYDSPGDSVFQEVFLGFTEITSSLQALTLTETLLSLSPPRSKRIAKDDYLKFLVASYLQEIYILRERLTTYAKKIARLYARNLGPDPAIKLFGPLLGSIDGSLAGVTQTRGSHVHVRRFSDQGLDLLSALALVNSVAEKPEYDLRSWYSITAGQWYLKVKSNNVQTKKLVDIYFDWLYPVVTHNGQVVLPKSAGQRRSRKPKES